MADAPADDVRENSALRARGIRAVIGDSIVDIFFSNALKNGLVPVRIDVSPG